MNSSTVISVYANPTEVSSWKGYAVRARLIRADGSPLLSQSIKQLAAIGLQAWADGAAESVIRRENDTIIRLLVENLAASRVLLLHLDKSGALFQKSRDNAKAILGELAKALPHA